MSKVTQGADTVYWICFGDSAKGGLDMARKDLEPSLDAGHILAPSDNYAQGDIRDVTDRAARADILMPWRGDPELDGTWQTEYQAQHWAALQQLDKVGGNPCEQCGLRYVVSRLYQKHIPVWVCEVGWIPVSEIAQANDRVRGACAVGVITGSRVMNTLLRLVPQPILRRYAARIERRSLQDRVTQSPRAGMAYFSTVGEAAPNILPYFYKRRRMLTETEQAILLTGWEVAIRPCGLLRRYHPVLCAERGERHCTNRWSCDCCTRQNRQSRGGYADLFAHPRVGRSRSA